jgi:branched-chain amino acid transport system permease protein
MSLLLPQLLSGLATGAIYALMALAVVMIYQAIDHLNFAQGEMAMFSTYIAWQLMQWGAPFFIALPLTLIFAFIFGYAIEKIVIAPLGQANVLAHVVLFIALYAIINAVAGFIWDYQIKDFPSPFGSGGFLGSKFFTLHQAGMVSVTLLLLVFLYGFFRFTKWGLAMRAAASNPDSASLVGINVGFTNALGWGLASVIGALAGILIAPVVFLEPNMMISILLYGFAGAVLGGLTSPLGAVIGGFLMGILENLAGTYIPGGAELKLPFALIIIVAVLVIKPAGLLGRKTVQRV